MSCFNVLPRRHPKHKKFTGRAAAEYSLWNITSEYQDVPCPHDLPDRPIHRELLVRERAVNWVQLASDHFEPPSRANVEIGSLAMGNQELCILLPPRFVERFVKLGRQRQKDRSHQFKFMMD
jgi:hypothetical protein